MTDPRLLATALVRHYRRGPEVVRALDGVSLTLDPGELIALVGPSGSGKTTLLGVLAGWEVPDAGAIEWSGGVPTRSWQRLAVVPQRLGLVEELTVRENVALPLRLAATPDDEVVTDLLGRLGLTQVADRLPDEVSLGEQQRTAIARALVSRPEVLLADELSAHQDEDSTRTVLAVLRERCDAGMTALLATHDPELLAGADRIVHMRDGRLVDDPAAA